jgi:hypothetical protein
MCTLSSGFEVAAGELQSDANDVRVAPIACNRGAEGTRGVLKKVGILREIQSFQKASCGCAALIAALSGLPK